MAVLNEMGGEKGAASAVKITAIRSPDKGVDRGTFVVTSIQATNVPLLPKGLPKPATVSRGHTLSTSIKQGKRVAGAIRDQQDVLIVEGFPQIDPETESLAVLAANTTTKKLQRAQQQATVIGEMMSST